MENDLEKFNFNSSEDELLETFEKWLKESTIYHDELLKFQKISEQYYNGNQTSKDQVPIYLSDTVENRIFEAVETVAPIATAAAHQFQVLSGSEEENSKMRAERLSKVLARKYQSLEIQEKLEVVTRKMLLYRFGVLKYLWDYDKDDIDVKEIDPRLILIPRLRVNLYDLPYVIEVQGYTKEELADNFGKAKIKDIAMKGKRVDTGEKNESKKVYQVFEVWTDEMVCWITSGIILEKKKHPYYDFEGKKVKKWNREKSKFSNTLKYFNHLDKPEKPFIFFPLFNVSDGPLPSTSLVEIGIPIQDAINVQKRAIINNLKQMGNGQVYADSDAMTEEEANNITNEPGLVIRGKGLASENKIKREAGVQLPNAHFANLQHSEMTFDNIMGIHSATRGQAEAKTLGQDILSRQQDYTRVDMVTRVLNRGVARLANGLVQLMKMFYTENHVVKIIGEQGAQEFVKLNQNDIEDYIEIEVKSGLNLPMDEVSLRTEAVQLWQLGAIDPITLFQRLKFPNPEKIAQALLAWKQGQLQMETQANIQQEVAGAQAKAQVETPETAGQGRGSEGFLDVLARARKSLGGTATKPASNTPKTANNK